jgi:hypothetical protein
MSGTCEFKRGFNAALCVFSAQYLNIRNTG